MRKIAWVLITGLLGVVLAAGGGKGPGQKPQGQKPQDQNQHRNRCSLVQELRRLPLEQVDMPEDQLRAAMETYGHDPGGPLTVLLKDDTRCIRCGLCAVRCPTEAMTMERFNFVETPGS